MHLEAGPAALRWDLFCRVIDNHGDLGVCWRLARRLAALGQCVRLWVDDAAALAWMAPHGAAGVSVLPWRDPTADESPGEVVIEAFGCDPPPAFVARMAAQARSPVWINLEYLSAEGQAESNHGLPSPQCAGPGAGLRKWFFYPGFDPAGGGLLLEDGLADWQAGFDASVWLASIGVPSQTGHRRVSLFCYEQPALAAALAAWCREPTQLLVTPGAAAGQVAAALGCGVEPGTRTQRGALEAHFLPWFSQPDYDRLLRACDLNHVRGEDSLVRALWAERPFVWQLYLQHDGAHRVKLQAFMKRYLQGAAPDLAVALEARFEHWNGAADGGLPALDLAAWRRHAEARAVQLKLQQREHGDLAQRLLGFALGKR